MILRFETEFICDGITRKYRHGARMTGAEETVRELPGFLSLPCSRQTRASRRFRDVLGCNFGNLHETSLTHRDVGGFSKDERTASVFKAS